MRSLMRRNHSCEFPVKVGERHGMHFGSRTLDTTEVCLVKRKGCVGYDEGAKAKITGRSCSRFDRVVRADTYDHKRRFAMRAKPAFQPCIYESIGDILLNDMFMLEWYEGRLELNSGLTRPEG